MSDLMTHPPCRRLGWYLPKPRAKFDLHSFYDAMSHGVWQEFEHHVRIIEIIRPYLIDWFTLNADADSLSRLCEEHGEAANNGSLLALPSSPASLEREAQAQRRLSHLLSSASGFRTRASVRLTEAFGNPSREVEAFNSAIAFWSEHSFAFRLILELGNSSKSHHPPIAFVASKSRARTEFRGEEARRLPVLRLSEISKNSVAEPSALTELSGQTIDLPTLISACLTAFGGLMLRVLQFYAGAISDLLHYTSVLYEKFNIPLGAVAVVWEGPHDSADPKRQWRAIELRRDEVETILALYQRLLEGPLPPDSRSNA